MLQACLRLEQPACRHALPRRHTAARARMALFALSLESVTGLKYLHFKEVHTSVLVLLRHCPLASDILKPVQSTAPRGQVRELVLSEGTAKTLCADVRVTPARLLCLHIHGSLLQPDSLRLGGYPALRSLSLQGAGLQAVPPVSAH